MVLLTKILAGIVEFVPNLWREFMELIGEAGGPIFLQLVIHYPRTTLAAAILVLMLASPFLFSRWKARNLQSYAGLEILGAFATILLILPWNTGVFDVNSYSVFLDIRRALPLLGAIYFGVRGIEDWNKATPTVR